MERHVEFVSYTGEYPCLCHGELIVKIDGKEVNLGDCLTSGGDVWFDEAGMEHVEEGGWIIYDYDIPFEYVNFIPEIEDVVNDNITWGCCGGCV